MYRHLLFVLRQAINTLTQLCIDSSVDQCLRRCLYKWQCTCSVQASCKSFGAGIDLVLKCNLGRAVTTSIAHVIQTAAFLQMQSPCSVAAHVCNSLGAGIDLGLEAELSVVVLSSGFSACGLLLLV